MIKNPQTGDIVRVRSTRGTNLVALWDTSRSKYVQGILCHAEPEMATDMDVVLARRTTEPTVIPPFLQEKLNLPPTVDIGEHLTGTVTPYPLVLCCDLYGQFLRTQVDKVVTHIDFPVGHPLLHPDEIAEALGGYRGLPIFRGTPRWDEKVRLLEEELRPLIYPFWEGFRW
jgi:hypothetical protein